MGDKVKSLEQRLEDNAITKSIESIVKVDQGSNTEMINIVTEENAEMVQLRNENKTLEMEIKKLEEELNSTLNKNNSIVTMRSMIKEKDTAIEEMKENNEFMESKLKEKNVEIDQLEKAIKQYKVECEITQKSSVQKNQEAEKERQEYLGKYTASRKEAAQLLHLNNQLKENVTKLEKELLEKSNQLEKKEPKEVEKPKPLRKTDEQNNNGEKNGTNNDKMTTITHEKIRLLCYSEVKEDGSCPKGTQCNFSHNLSEEIKQNREVVLNMIGQKSLCINEFNKKGSCFKGERCRFHHNISDEQRNNPLIKESMRRKQARMQPQKRPQYNNGERPICVYEYLEADPCPWGENCKFSHEITEDQKGDQRLQEVMRNKMRLIQPKIQRTVNSGLGEEANINIPREALCKMINLLSNSSEQGATVEEAELGGVNIPEKALQAMINMLQNSPSSRF